MLKKLLMFIAMLYASVVFAAVDVNQASAAELDGVKGIGPAISSRIVDERQKGTFKDWSDLLARVKGIGPKSAVKLSENGLTVGGSTYNGAPAKASAAPAPAKAAPTAPAAATPPAPAAPAKAAPAPAAAAKPASTPAPAPAAAPVAPASSAKK
ncbi:MAG: helix-hairpin-helix domain-containing protein [Burkholderiaceae bacterium]|nr:helix-hairpin-helix domain-containing protein [Burkholderiaceae bacterium]